MSTKEDTLEEYARDIGLQFPKEVQPNTVLGPEAWDPVAWYAAIGEERKTVPWDDPELRASNIKKLVGLGATQAYATEFVDQSTREHFETFYRLHQSTGEKKHIMLRILRNGGYFLSAEIKGRTDSHTRRVSDIEDLGLVLDKERYEGGLKYIIRPDKFTQRRDPRRPWSKTEKRRLLDAAQHQCAFCDSPKGLNLECDHRVPWRVAGETEVGDLGMSGAIQILCSHHNMLKQTACKGCANHRTDGDPEVCRSCYWHGGRDFTHVAEQPHRLLTIQARTPEDVELLTGLDPDEAIGLLREALIAAGRKV